MSADEVVANENWTPEKILDLLGKNAELKAQNALLEIQLANLRAQLAERDAGPIDTVRAQIRAMWWHPVTVTPPEGVLLDLLVEQGVYLGREFCAPTGRAGDGPFPVKAAAWRLWRPAPPDSEEDGDG